MLTQKSSTLAELNGVDCITNGLLVVVVVVVVVCNGFHWPLKLEVPGRACWFAGTNTDIVGI